MPTMLDYSWNDHVLRASCPSDEGPFPTLILLHGWGGDETSMDIFAKKLLDKYLVVAPRGIYNATEGGYGWQNYLPGRWPQTDEFQPALQYLSDILDELTQRFPQGDFTRPNWMGFSQGGGLAYTWAMRHPERVNKLAGLAAFLPNGAAALAAQKPLAGKEVFVAHGTQDKMVPIGRARQAVQILEQAGARVRYCEAETGHQVSLECIHALEAYFNDL
jgi:phospholipase/carboxylesterase